MADMIVKSTEKKFENGAFKIVKVIEEANITESDLLQKKNSLQFQVADLKKQRQSIDQRIAEVQGQITECDEMLLAFEDESETHVE